MSFEKAKFGDGVSTPRVQEVHNHYGTREEGQTVGQKRTAGSTKEVTINVTGEMLNRTQEFLVAPKLPVGAVIEKVYMQVTEAFVLGGTTPGIEIGTEASEATNGFSITEAQAETVATVDLTSALSGTWASPIAAETTVGIAMSGTSPTADANAGSMDVVIVYTQAT